MYVVKATECFKLFTQKEKASAGMGKIGVSTFRELAEAAPPLLGKYCSDNDAFVFTLPEDEAGQQSLRVFANTTVAFLKATLKKRAGRAA